MICSLRERIVRILKLEIPNPFMPIHWDEPYAFTRMVMKLDAAQFTFGQLAKLSLIIAALLMLNWFLASVSTPPESGRQPLSFALALLVSGVGGFVLAGFLCLVYFFAPRRIGLNKKVLLCIRGSSQRRWPYDKIAGIRFDTMRFGDKGFTIMFVDLKDDRDMVFGVSKKTDLMKVVDFLRSRDVEVAEKTREPLEQK